MRATIYARYSSELQSETSIEDQVRVCRARAEREGWAVASVHSDSAVSGTVPVDRRAGGRELLADVVLGGVQALLLEGLDRLSRDQVEQERVVRRLEYHGVRIIGVSDGYDSASAARRVLRGVRGLINEVYLDDLRSKVHRGMAGLVSRGYTATRPCYGYRLVAIEGGSRHEIDEDEAQWVRWIFQQYASGTGLHRIAYQLNALRVPSPGGSAWQASLIYGSPQQARGLFHRAIYVGRFEWNKTRTVRDPDSGRRRAVLRPRSEWIVQERPELRIVDDATWDAVQARLAEGRDAEGRRPARRPAQVLLSGLLRCPHCGNSMTAANAQHYGCVKRKHHGASVCRGFLIRRDVVERRLLSWVREELLTPEAAEAYEAAFKAAIEADREQINETELRLREQTLQAEVWHLVDGIAAVGASPALASRLTATEDGLVAVRRQLKALRRAPVIPDVRRMFAQQLLDLSTALTDAPARARRALREILGAVALRCEDDAVYADVQTLELQLVAAGGRSTSVTTGSRRRARARPSCSRG
jgi:DNA invertase Pin-like site-specific DNA recombinase